MASTSVLIVDDEDLIRRLVMNVMEDEGYVVRGARNGREAIDECARHLPDLVLLDLRMPVLDGYSALAEMDRLGLPGFPVIVVTGNANFSCDFSARVTDVLRKPFDLDHLCRAVRHALGVTAASQWSAPSEQASLGFARANALGGRDQD